MKYVMLLCLLLPSVFAHAQDENWETYMGKIGKKPASILVNLALINNPPYKQYPFLLISGPKCRQCLKSGLPEKDEIAKLEEILDAADKFITGITPKLLVGTLTYNNERVNYYYIKDTVGIANALARMYRQSYHEYAYVYKIKSDPDWSIYRTFLYPTDDNFTWIENDKIITNLLQQGDKLTKQRDITFVIDFDTEADRKAFMEYAHSRDYKVEELNYIKKSVLPYQIKISKYENINSDNLFDLTVQLKKEVKKLNGQYNGWSSPVIP